MKLVVITPDKAIHNETGIVNELFTCGLQRLHIRKPFFTADDYRDYLNSIEPQYHKYISLHDCFDLYHEFGTGGIHLSSFARNEPGIWNRVNDIPLSAISTSFHAWQEIQDNLIPYGYVFISPVFDSISKEGYKAGIKLEEVKKAKSVQINRYGYCPAIIGLGGVIGDNITTLYQNGFDGGAMLGGIWFTDDPVTSFRRAYDITCTL